MTSSSDKEITAGITKWMGELKSEYIGIYTIWAYSCDSGCPAVQSSSYLMTRTDVYRLDLSLSQCNILYGVRIAHIYQFENVLSNSQKNMLLSYASTPTYILHGNRGTHYLENTTPTESERFLSFLRGIPGKKL